MSRLIVASINKCQVGLYCALSCYRMANRNTEYTNIINKVIIIIKGGFSVDKWVKTKGDKDVMGG